MQGLWGQGCKVLYCLQFRHHKNSYSPRRHRIILLSTELQVLNNKTLKSNHYEDKEGIFPLDNGDYLPHAKSFSQRRTEQTEGQCYETDFTVTAFYAIK